MADRKMETSPFLRLDMWLPNGRRRGVKWNEQCIYVEPSVDKACGPPHVQGSLVGEIVRPASFCSILPFSLTLDQATALSRSRILLQRLSKKVALLP